MTPIADLFDPPPDIFAYRGDEVLWHKMTDYFAGKPMPPSRAELVKSVEGAFIDITGKTLENVDQISLPHLDQGGMSGGIVSPAFWLFDALNILTSRYKGKAPATRDYFAELYVAGLFGDAGWCVYFPKRDVGFDFIVSKQLDNCTLIRPVQVKGRYPTVEKLDKLQYGFRGNLTSVHPDMVLALAYFAAKGSSEAPACIAYLPWSALKRNDNGSFRSEPASLKSGKPSPRRDFSHYFGELGLAEIDNPLWGKAA
jgi:hypothetical protein